MGSTAYRDRLTIDQIIDKEYEGMKDQIVHRVGVNAESGSGWTKEIYVARKLPNGTIFCEVVLVKFYDTETIVKIIDETMGPSTTQCPKSILKFLTPPLNDTTRKWRDQCIKNDLISGSRKKMLRDMNVGDVLTFDVSYQGNRSLKCMCSIDGRRNRQTLLFSPLGSTAVIGLRGYKKHLIAISKPDATKNHEKFELKQKVGLNIGAASMCQEWAPREGVIEELHVESDVPYASVLWNDATSFVNIALCVLESKI